MIFLHRKITPCRGVTHSFTRTGYVTQKCRKHGNEGGCMGTSSLKNSKKSCGEAKFSKILVPLRNVFVKP